MRAYAALVVFAGHLYPHCAQRQSSDVLGPLIVVSSFTVPNAPQLGQGGGISCE
jgi:hypothetical protein